MHPRTVARWIMRPPVRFALAASLFASAACGTAAAESRCPGLPDTMRAVRLAQYGGADRLKLETIPVPSPAAGEVLVAVRASSVNPIDWKLREGYAQRWWPLELPAVMGLDLSGVVVGVGEGASGWRCGDEVVAYLGPKGRGAYADYARVDAAVLAKKPASLGFVEAGAYPLVALTAWQSVVDAGEVKAGDRVLVHGGAGGVGSFAVQFAKARGARVVATASARNHGYLESLGADEAIDYRAVRFEDAVEAVDLVVDTVGGDTTTRSAAVLGEGGRLVTIAGQLPDAACRERKLVCRDVLVAPDAADLAAIGALIDAGKVRVHVDASYPLERVGEAQEANRAGHTRGKIAIAVAGKPAS